MPTQLIQNQDITLSFSVAELSQLEAFATLHGLSVTAFIHRAALDAAHISASKKKTESKSGGDSWMNDDLLEIPTEEEVSAPPVQRLVPDEPEADETPAAKRGVAGEPSKLAKGQGLVWEIRRALSQERIHGLGWTREQLAFVLKLSVVGIRKMEHDGTRPVKSIEARKGLLNLTKTLENPSAEIASYIEEEEAALTKLKAI